LHYGIPLPDESVDFSYSSHLLEHLYKEHGAHLVQECFRTLRKGGRIRIVVPDLEYAFSLHRQGEKERALDLFCLRSCSGLLGRHEYMYDFDLLAALLTKSGFAQVERYMYQQGGLPDLRLLDTCPRNHCLSKRSSHEHSLARIHSLVLSSFAY
jgi:SAM-dependent methyltransferase